MSRPGRPPKSQQRLLTQEDEALWSSVARSLKPVRKKARVPAAEPENQGESPAETPLPPTLTGIVMNAAPQSSKPPEFLQSEPRKQIDRNPPALADIDRRQIRRIVSGRTEIEARIDLHGMRASEAHAALRAFVFDCFARGRRNVLVITGKGSGADLSDRPFALGERSDRGVLKRSVPIWLADPDLRAVVMGFTQAHARHGGEGALYVQLRSRNRIGDRV